MAKSRKGVLFLAVGIVALLGGIGILISGIFPFIGQFKAIAVVESPGQVRVGIEEPGTYTLWHDHYSIHNGKTVTNDVNVPSGFSYALRRESNGVIIPLAPSRAHTTLSTGSRQSVGVGTFEPNRAGSHVLEIGNPAGDQRIFSLTQGSFLSGMAKFGLNVVLGGIVMALGLVLLVLGIVFMVTNPKPDPGRQPPPPLVQG